MPLVNPPVIIQNNGTVQGAINTENLTGGLSASVTGNVAIITITGLPVGSIAPGTAGQILQTNAGPSTVWVTMSGDVTISATGATTVNSISGSSPIAITPANLQWATGTAAPILSQADKTTGSGTGATLTIQAQNETGATSNGGVLTLTSGTGTSLAGNVLLRTGTTTRITISPTNITVAAFGTAGVVHNDSSGNLSSSLIVNADVNSSAAIAYSKLALTNSIVNADINASAAIAYSKLNLTGDIVNADIASGAAIAVSKLAAGTSAQILLNNATPTPTWTTINGDGTISATGVFSATYNFVDTFLFMGA